ncbi:MAG: methyltransferase domain-containing protein [Betaproteobacteria bacterium]|nr:methyltransferase domain-containing protein [Betaproteobacteria bacterium]
MGSESNFLQICEEPQGKIRKFDSDPIFPEGRRLDVQYVTNLFRTTARELGRATLVLVPGVFATCAWAAEPSVPYVPTPQEVVERMLQIARVTAADYVIDLGSGDGRIVITAAKKHGARGFGVDLNPERISEANANAKKAGVIDKVAFYQRDLFVTDLSEATVITMYLLPRVNLELRPKLLDLKPGTRLVSHDFSMDDWKPDAHVQMEAKEKYGGSGGKSDIYFWVVPAKVGGVWQWEIPVSGKRQGYEVALAQKFQTISGSVKMAGRNVSLQNPRLRGDHISFTFTAQVNGEAVKHEFTGKIEGETIAGVARLSGGRIQAQLDWSARRAGKTARIGAAAPFASVVLDTSR